MTWGSAVSGVGVGEWDATRAAVQVGLIGDSETKPSPARDDTQERPRNPWGKAAAV